VHEREAWRSPRRHPWKKSLDSSGCPTSPMCSPSRRTGAVGVVLQGSDRPRIVSEGIRKAGVVHVQQFPQIVFPACSATLCGTEVVRSSKGREVAVDDRHELVGIWRSRLRSPQLDSLRIGR
jgi:hypothetical protein